MKIFDSILLATRFNKQGTELIQHYSEILLSVKSTIVEGDYGTLYQHPKSMEIFKKSNRFQREAILGVWWQKTITSNFDQRYWEWQVYVGLVLI